MEKGIPDFLIQQIPPRMEEDRETGWGRKMIYLGPTSATDELCMHAGVVSGHVTPHPPHCHGHEELHIALSDNFEFVGCEADSEIAGAKHVERDSLFLIDARSPHSFRNTTSEPASYLHVRWRNETPMGGGQMKRLHFYYAPVSTGRTYSELPYEGSETIEVFAGPSLHLERFRALFINLGPGGVIPIHRHPHEVIFALLSGSVEILGRKVDAPCLAFIGSRMPHGIINQGKLAARLYAFEFHQSA